MEFMMKKIESYSCIAPKISGTGNIEYCLWVDTEGNLYVQIIGNEAAGTFSKYLFSVSQYQGKRKNSKSLGNLTAFNVESGKIEPVADNNNDAFIKAILNNLLPDD